ncbi:transglutaminase-like domain-containing protein [Kamptonema formosum]|uniref:transglutaminase-like domain-containing protein n=1 Tax=Kamptonema formosum TaxID=331992 RepID=UPI00034BD203|nr:transglutaminase family protein [Oscillatoria sp. PCC 10802]
MKFHAGCQLNYSIAQPSTFVFNIQVINSACQKICQESLLIDPQLDIDECYCSSGERRYFRVSAPAGKLQVSYEATADIEHFYANPEEIPEVPPADLPLEIIPLLYPSRYCESDLLLQLAQSEFGELEPGYSRVTGICNWIYDRVKYLSGSTDSQTSAYQTAIERAGVCRDFAHLGIALCRALNIPARFFAGYAWGLNPPDFHACFEAYLGNRWYFFDPTRLAPQTGIIRIATGRDAADVSFATIFGPAQLERMQLFVEPVGEAGTGKPEPPPYTTAAIAIS